MKAFTLLELIVVIIIIAVLGSIGYTQYNAAVERSRTVEAVQILGAIRTAQEAYYLEYGIYSIDVNYLLPDYNLANLKYFGVPMVQFFTMGSSMIALMGRKNSSLHYFLVIDSHQFGTIFCFDVDSVNGSACRNLGFPIEDLSTANLTGT